MGVCSEPRRLQWLTQGPELPLSAVLPLETLRDVRDLSIHCYWSHWDRLEWPATWGQAASVTRLDMKCFVDFQYTLPAPGLLTGMTSLREVTLCSAFKEFDKVGEAYVCQLTSSLPALRMLAVNITGVLAAEHRFPIKKCWRIRLHKSRGRWVWGAERRLERICKRVCRSMPGMFHSLIVDEAWTMLGLIDDADCEICFFTKQYVLDLERELDALFTGSIP